MMKSFLVSLVLFFCPLCTFCADSSADETKVSINTALPLLESIENEAITIGTGSKKLFVFVDPMCPHSRDFMDMIVSSDSLQKQFTYKIFLYQLSKKFDSKGLIEAIYENLEAKQALVDIMALSTEQTAFSNDYVDSNITKKIQTIEDVASQLKVFKRPYIFVSTESKSI